MNRPKIVLISSLIVVSMFASRAEQKLSQKSWKLVWHDEFKGRKLDAAKWNILLREDSKHDELQYYLPDEVYLEKGWLRLRSRERVFGSKHYTSGRLDT